MAAKEAHNSKLISSDLKTGNIPTWCKAMGTTAYRVSFSGLSQNYIVGLVDMVGSTKISSKLKTREWGLYYEIFLNTMAALLQRFDGCVIKNVGDGLLYYFPESFNYKNTNAFSKCFE
ncbi:hypothetical protein [Nitrosopumilus sp. b2]|uniref:hypothetical protein n=1 Tax=Nitrosopumilus sp. b2 TaxID=2109908 RepID=UPI0015F769F0|nr:hypothetical protein [Nitrosopumilus sp. b2]KAF6245113.1 hypothetical protein C6989_05350 [Nitrosopumilus sp. b2]